MRRTAASGARHLEVHLRNLHLSRDGRRVLRDISWTIRPHERWVLAGRNGAGKTQLLKIISGAVWPTPPHAPAAQPPAQRRYVRGGQSLRSPFEVRHDIAYVGPEQQDQYQRRDWNYTVERIVGTGIHRTQIPLDPLGATDRARIQALLKRLDILPLAKRRFLALSYGEQRLTLLARALAARPRLLLLDELFTGLDEEHRARIRRWLERSSRSPLPWILTTHRLLDVPDCATHALILDRGRIVYCDGRRRAPLAHWLTGPVRRGESAARPARARRHSPMCARLLIGLRRASVFLDERRTLGPLTLEIRAHQCWVVHGRNGSGKTTLLRALYGDYGIARGGRIERIGIGPGIALETFRKRVGIVASHLHVDQPRNLTVAEAVQSGMHASIGLNEPTTRAARLAALRVLRAFGLTTLRSRRLRQLSHGQLQRVVFARAWACRPMLLLLDEPFSGIDRSTREALQQRIGNLLPGGAAAVIAAHDRSDWPPCTTHELQLTGGRIEYCGPVRSVRRGSNPHSGAAA